MASNLLPTLFIPLQNLMSTVLTACIFPAFQSTDPPLHTHTHTPLTPAYSIPGLPSLQLQILVRSSTKQF